jgi:hypothetical protein
MVLMQSLARVRNVGMCAQGRLFARRVRRRLLRVAVRWRLLRVAVRRRLSTSLPRLSMVKIFMLHRMIVQPMALRFIKQNTPTACKFNGECLLHTHV